MKSPHLPLWKAVAWPAALMSQPKSPQCPHLVVPFFFMEVPRVSTDKEGGTMARISADIPKASC